MNERRMMLCGGRTRAIGARERRSSSVVQSNRLLPCYMPPVSPQSQLVTNRESLERELSELRARVAALETLLSEFPGPSISPPPIVAHQISERRQRRYNTVLVELATSPRLSGPLDDVLRFLGEVAARTLEVARVNIWLYNADRTKIHCIEHFDAELGQHTSGAELAAEMFPNYFRAIELERTIAADDAVTDARTNELAAPYLVPEGIASLIDAPVRSGGRMIGIMCSEHLGPARHWSNEEQQFAGTLADFVSLALAASERQQAEEAVRDREERLRHVLENMPVMLQAFDEQGHTIFWNRECEKVTGYSAEEIIGNPHADEWLYPDAEYRQCMFAEWRAKGDFRDWEWTITCRDGSRRSILRSNISHSVPVPGWATWGIDVDISSRKQAEDSLRRAHDELEERVIERTAALSAANTQLQQEVAERARVAEELRRQMYISRSVLDSISDGVVVVDGEGEFIAFNPAAERILHREWAQLPPTNWSEYYALYLPDRVTPYPADELPLMRAVRGEVVDNAEIFVRPQDHPDGLWIAVSARRLTEFPGAVAIFHDITERKRAIEANEAERVRMRQMLLAHERYTRLIAYEIHDGLVQDVTGALMHLEAIRQKQPPTAGAVADEFDLCLRLLRDSIDEARRLISGLRPPIIDEQGLVAALQYLVSEAMSRSNIDIAFDCNTEFDKLETLLETTLFRVAQEALTNVRRHSHARRALVRLVKAGDRVQLEVRDWGVGFDPARISDHRFGIYGIKERARILRGEARIESAPGEGTRVFVDLPIAHAAHLTQPRSLA
ncbi:MAG: PAS domain S-box protein [Pirellulales bacterium]|nr:PAS domain S-box protein [Pirellulales bacterium]